MQKKGDIWISAVLYFGLGILVLSIILAAGLPVINKLRDKNVIIQTKTVMYTLDQNIREVIKEGPGSQRVVTINIKKGSLTIDNEKSKIIWVYKNSNVIISDPDTPVFEGKLEILTVKTPVTDKYDITISADYSGIAKLVRDPSKSSTLIGISDLVIRNDGIVKDLVKNVDMVQVKISETNK